MEKNRNKIYLLPNRNQCFAAKNNNLTSLKINNTWYTSQIDVKQSFYVDINVVKIHSGKSIVCEVGSLFISHWTFISH